MVTIFAVLYYLMNSKYLLNQQELSYQVPVDRIISTYAILWWFMNVCSIFCIEIKIIFCIALGQFMEYLNCLYICR